MMRFLFLLPLTLLLASCSGEEESMTTVAAEEDCCETLDGEAVPTQHSEESLFLLDQPFRDQTGKPFRMRQLSGRPTVMAMVFTHCEFACPAILQDLRRLEEGMSVEERDATRWVLVSFDAERDVPEVLAAYAEREELDSSRWTLLHGDEGGVRELAALLGVRYKPTPDGGFSHSNRISLLNENGELVAKVDGLNVDVSPLVEARRGLDRVN